MKVGMISLGCPKNRTASEQMLYKLREAGHEIVSDEREAEAIVVNTCAFIEDAKQEAIDTILETAQLRETGKLKRLIVAGCLAQLYKDEVLRELPEVDAVLGVGSYDEVVTALDDTETGTRPCIIGDNCAAVSETPRIISTGGVWAYLLVAEGCDNRCSYCLIPQIRGKFRSRPMESVLNEARELASRGYKELILVAQDLTRYGTELYGPGALSKLLRELAKIEGIEWLRLHYLYPHELDDELIETVASEPKIVKYLDIPIQHINNGILRKMNRRDRAEDIKPLFRKLRERIPGLVLRTSLITGLPGEGEAEFEELCAYLREARIERAGVFPFSPEEGTPAYSMPHVDEDTARLRAQQVQELQALIMDEWEASLIGKCVAAICEERVDADTLSGRGYFDSPGIDGTMIIKGDAAPGAIVTVRIISADSGELVGEIVK